MREGAAPGGRTADTPPVATPDRRAEAPVTAAEAADTPISGRARILRVSSSCFTLYGRFAMIRLA